MKRINVQLSLPSIAIVVFYFAITLLGNISNLKAQPFGTETIVSNQADSILTVFFSDLDNDGNDDIISACYNDDNISWYRNNGDGNFGGRQIISNVVFEATSSFATDLDGDNDKDVLSASYGAVRIAWHENDGSGNFSPQQTIDDLTSNNVNQVHANDLDGDGDMDVISATNISGIITWYENDGTGNFIDSTVLISNGFSAKKIYTSDLDNDNDIDILVTTFGASTIGQLGWFENDGSGNFDNKHILDSTSVFSITAHIIDLDQDGDNDILHHNGIDGLKLYKNNGSGIFNQVEIIDSLPAIDFSITTSDIDDDNDIDIIATFILPDSNKIIWYENDGDNNFNIPKVLTRTTSIGANSINAFDFDDDGDIDILYAASGNDKIAIFPNLRLNSRISDSLALVMLYDSCGGNAWINNSNWLMGDLDTWAGITVDGNGRVTNVNLASNNLIGELPPSIKNLSELITLRLESNSKLTGHLDVSNLTKLESVICYLDSIHTLTLTNTPALRELQCQENDLTSLDVTENVLLEDFRCHYNQLTTVGDISNFSNLTYLRCDFNDIQNLDLTGCVNLETIWCNNNQSIGSLGDISGLTKLNALRCYWNGLSSLDVSNALNLNTLECQRNNLTTLDLSNNDSLSIINVHGNQLTSLPNISDLENLTYLRCDENDLRSLDVSSCSNLVTLQCNLNRSLGSLGDISQLVNLETLICWGDSLEVLDVSNNTSLHTLWCQSNDLSSLDVSNNDSLSIFYCHSNNLTELLGVEDLFKLKNFRCDENQLTTLGDLSSLQELLSFDASSNNLTKLDLSSASKLTNLYIQVNPRLKELIGTENLISLIDFRCQNDSLAIINLSNSNNLARLSCRNNQLQSIGNLSNASQLVTLDCYNNKIDSLDLSSSNLLSSLICYNNELKSLGNLGVKDSLTNFQCHINKLQFGELESFVAQNGLPPVYNFSNQTPYVDTVEIGVIEGGTINLSAAISGNLNQQNWFKDGSAIGNSDSVYNISNASISDTGIYYSLVSNSVVPGLNIEGQKYNLKILADSTAYYRYQDSLVLVNLYQRMEGENWINKEGWLVSGLETWDNIVIRSDRVVEINLVLNNQGGVVPDSVMFLDSLEVLNIRGSSGWYVKSMNDSLPSWINYENFPNLKYIDFFLNRFIGVIPEQLSTLKNLEHLNIGYCTKMNSQTVPQWLNATNFPKLQYLLLGNIPFNGTLPDGLGTLSQLTEFRIASTTYMDTIAVPSWLNSTSFPQLQALELTKTSLSGAMEDIVGVGFDSLQVLRIGGNPFNSGPIPSSLNATNYPNISVLSLSNTNRTGELLPTFLKSLSTLSNLSLSSNAFDEGTLPDFSVFDDLIYLFLTDVNLTGQLEDAALSNPYNKLVYFYIGENKFNEGLIPSWLNTSNFPKLNYLNLDSDSLTGASPLFELNQLIRFEADHNFGLGKDGIDNFLTQERFPNLTYIKVSNGDLDTLPSFSATLNNLVGLHVPNNKLHFDDLERNNNHSFRYGFWYWNQKPFTDTIEIGVVEGNATALQAAVRGANNIYDWVKEGTGGQGSNDSIYIATASTNDEGIYYANVTNSVITDLTIKGQAYNLSVFADSVALLRAQDSLALVDLYQQCGGSGWTNKTGWEIIEEEGDSLPIDQWYGVSIVNNRVAELQLNANDLSGSIPDINLTKLIRLFIMDNHFTGNIPDFSNLPLLTSLQISNAYLDSVPDFSNLANLTALNISANLLKELPDFSSLNALVSLNVTTNSLTDLPTFSNLDSLKFLSVSDNVISFEDIIPNLGVPSINFNYSPQSIIFPHSDTSIYVTQNSNYIFDLGVDEEVSTSIYTWEKDEQPYVVLDSNKISFNNFADEDTGTYRVTITNSLVPGLTLNGYRIILKNNGSRTIDSLALVDLYTNCGGLEGEWADATNWLSGPLNTWHGVTMVNNRVTELELVGANYFTKFGMRDTIPSSFNNLKELIFLSLNHNQLKSVELSNLPKLQTIRLGWSVLDNLRLSNLPALETLICDHNELQDLSDIENLTSLTRLEFQSNKIDTLDVSNLTALESIQCDHNEFEDFDVSNLSELRSFIIGDNDSLKQIDVTNNPKLEVLYCNGTGLDNLDISQNPLLFHLRCGDNNLTSLNIANHDSLQYLQCEHNNLTSLTFPDKLVSVACNNNAITNLDLLNLPGLTNLGCGNNQISQLDLSAATNLQYLACSGNPISNLDVSMLNSLIKLTAAGDSLETLLLPSTNSFKELRCEYNKLTNLDVSSLPNLEVLFCNDNRLTSLKLGEGYQLKDLRCFDNQLSSLDIDSCFNLVNLNCSDNKLSKLDFGSYNPINSITNLVCFNNNISELDTVGLRNTTSLQCQNNELAYKGLGEIQQLVNYDTVGFTILPQHSSMATNWAEYELNAGDTITPDVSTSTTLYRWEKNGVPIPPATFVPGGEFTFPDTSGSDSGDYLYASVDTTVSQTDTLYGPIYRITINDPRPQAESQREGNKLVIDLSSIDDDSIKAEIKEELRNTPGVYLIDACPCGGPELWFLPDSLSIELNNYLNFDAVASLIKTKTDAEGDGKGKVEESYKLDDKRPVNDSFPYRWEVEYEILNPKQDTIVLSIIDQGTDMKHPALLDYRWSPEVRFCSSVDSFLIFDEELGGYLYQDSISKAEGIDRANDETGHGTAIAGVITNTIDENAYISILNQRIAGKDNEATLFKAVCALHTALAEGAKVVNLSLGYWGFRSAIFEGLIHQAAEQDVLIVVSAGNDSTNLNEFINSEDGFGFYPANYSRDSFPNLITVGGYGDNKDTVAFSNYGDQCIDIAGPSKNIRTTQHKTNSYTWFSGTSMAAPYVVSILSSIYSGLGDTSSYENVLSYFLDNFTVVDPAFEGKTRDGRILSMESQYLCAIQPILKDDYKFDTILQDQLILVDTNDCIYYPEVEYSYSVVSQGNKGTASFDDQTIGTLHYAPTSTDTIIIDTVMYKFCYESYDSNNYDIELACDSAIVKVEILSKPFSVQQIQLTPGWNKISSYILTDNVDMSEVLKEVESDITIIKDGSGDFAFPNVGYYDLLPTWDVTKGYKLRSESSMTLTIKGEKLNPEDTMIVLEPGWNTVAYFRDNSIDASIALSNIYDNLEIVKNNDGYFTLPNVPLPLAMEPGQGYKLRVAAVDTIYYPSNTLRVSNNSNTHQARPEYFVIEGKTGSNASIIIESRNCLGLMLGDELGVFGSNGQLSGAGIYEGEDLGITIWGSEEEEVGRYLSPDESFIIKIWRSSTEELLSTELSFKEREARYVEDGIYWVEQLSALFNLTDVTDNELMQVSCYPNPAKDVVFFDFSILKQSSIKILITNHLGEIVKEKHYKKIPNGSHQVRLNIGDLPSGHYTYSIYENSGFTSSKFVIIR